MNRKELADAIAERADISRAKANDMLGALIEIVQERVKAGEDVQLVGFGTFTAKERAARTGRNPFTGEALEIKAGRVPTFKVGKPFKDALNS